MSPANRRNAPIDALRGLAILLVLALHYCLLMPHRFNPLSEKVVTLISRNGYYGVSIFFVISGFLITSTCFRRFGALSEMSLADFYAMRFARIVPPLLLFLVVFLSLHYSGIPQFRVLEPWTMTWAALTLRFNLYFQTWKAGWWGVLWSLSIEEMFYLLFPVVCIITRKLDVLVVLLLVVLVQGPIFRAHHFGVFDYRGTFDLLAMGCLTAIAARARVIAGIQKLRGIALMLFGLALIAFVYAYRPYQEIKVWGPSLIGLGAALFLLPTAAIGSHGLLSGAVAKVARPLSAYLEANGRFSYEIYLFHAGILLALGLLVPNTNPDTYSWPFLLVSLAVLLGCGWLTGTYFSNPLNRWLRVGVFSLPDYLTRPKPPVRRQDQTTSDRIHPP